MCPLAVGTGARSKRTLAYTYNNTRKRVFLRVFLGYNSISTTCTTS
ncbi:hypothetical protein HMPREF3232_00559 [Fannyhessea vaginae]|nr:hypothetical protein HMPREF3232_00559 [Fannyhessea vaginae]